MVPLTRRRAIQVCAATVAVAAAGCTDADDAGLPDDDESDGIDDVLTDVKVETLRFDASDDEVIEETETDGRRSRLPYVVEREHLDALEFRVDPIDDVDDPLAFLRAIDYEEATGVIVETALEACYEASVQYVEPRSSGEGVRIQFCQGKRDPDVECALDDRQIQVTMLELPVAYETPPSGFGSGYSSTCDVPPEQLHSEDGDGE